VKLKEEGLDLALLGFAIRLKRKIEDYEIDEDQIEPIIHNFAAYWLRHNISFDKLIQSGCEALYLEEKFRIHVEKITDYIMRAKETIDNLEDHRQDILRKNRRHERSLMRYYKSVIQQLLN
jgi:hypothetical protein